MKPLVTVLMAVRNGQPYLKVAIESILDQTYSNFDFLIIDDESRDNTREVIKSYDDSRIKLICLSENIGQTAALNIGLNRISTPWVARMDADDYSEPTRLEEQIQVIKANPSVCCIGTNAWVFRNDPSIIDEIIKKPVNDHEIKKYLLHDPPIIHGSILINLDVFKEVGFYDERFRVSADFDLYERLLTPTRKAVNIPKPLLGIRRHQGQETKSLIAIEEAIEIFNRRLLKSSYSKEEKTIIKRRVSFFYLLRARYKLKKSIINGEYLMDIMKAFIISPFSIFYHFYKTIIIFYKKLKI